MFHAGDLVQRRCSSCSAAFKHQRTSACSAKKSKKPDRKQKSKTWSETSAPSMPDTASLHLQYARMLDLDPTLAMKRVVEGATPGPDSNNICAEFELYSAAFCASVRISNRVSPFNSAEFGAAALLQGVPDMHSPSSSRSSTASSVVCTCSRTPVESVLFFLHHH